MFAHAARWSFLALSGLLLAAACDDGTGGGFSDPSVDGDDDGSDGSSFGGDGDDGEDGEDGEDGPEGVPDGQSNACARYVDCIAAVRPAMLSEVESSVGEDGACWDGSDSTREACDQGCADALDEERWAADGEEERCNECEEDADCAASRPRCWGAVEHGFEEGAARYCVECMTDQDCAAGSCDLGRCVEADVEACVDFAMVTATVGVDAACARECLEDLDLSCSPSEICCMLRDGPLACEGDVDCVDAMCERSTACDSRREETAWCITDYCGTSEDEDW